MTITISRILHAGYVFEAEAEAGAEAGLEVDPQGPGGTSRIAFDPIFENPFSRNCHAFPDVRFDRARIGELKFDAVFISHFHDDHCSFESLDLLDRSTPIYLYCLFEELFDLIRELGFVHVHALRIDAPVKIGCFEVIAREALDADVDSLFQIQCGGLNVLNVVDAWIGPDTLAQLAACAPWDMVLWPFQTMREIDVISPSRAQAAPEHLPDDWIDQLRILNPRYVVPSSCQFVQEDWSWYNDAFFPVTYRQFQREVETALPGAKVVRLNPSVSVRLDAHALHAATPLAWVLPLGDQDVDYRYDPGLAPPHTSDIARRFEALNDAQTARVLGYCRSGLLEKYRDMELAPDSYFATARLWHLAVYDHAGLASDFYYRVQGDTIDYLEPAALHAGELPAWRTEIPIARCYAALELGETLTSMYLRINDGPLDAASADEIAGADIVDDPLIRCLFNDAFAAYQCAQLARIRAGSQSAA